VIQDRTDQELLGQARQFSTVLTTQGLGAVEAFAVLEAQGAGEKKVFFRLLYPTGQVFSSSNMSYWQDIKVRETALAQVLGREASIFETLVLQKRKDKVRILYALIAPQVILQVGQSMEASSRFLEAFQRIFVATMVLLIGVAAGVGWFMARRAVSGVEEVTRTAQVISGGNLEKRVPVQSGGDEIDQLAMTFNQMLERIQGLLKEVREMSDNIAQDLKSPITRIRGMAEVTLTTGRSLSEYQNVTASTIEECDRLLDMINAMLMISRTEAGVDRFIREKINLSSLVRDACELFGPMAEDKGLKLRCSVPDSSPTAGDLRMLQRMIANLLDNAIKYTPAGGEVNVTLTEINGKGAAIVVADTGIGIPPQDLPRIFERFYRGDESRSQPGIGLGLSLARAIARAHGGDITVTSTVNRGSVFTAVLPKSP